MFYTRVCRRLLMWSCALFALSVRPGVAQEHADALGHSTAGACSHSWVGRLLDRVLDGEAYGSAENISGEPLPAEGSVAAYLSEAGYPARRYVPVLEQLGVSDWAALGMESVGPDARQNAQEALAVATLLLREAIHRATPLGDHPHHRGHRLRQDRAARAPYLQVGNTSGLHQPEAATSSGAAEERAPALQQSPSRLSAPTHVEPPAPQPPARTASAAAAALFPPYWLQVPGEAQRWDPGAAGGGQDRGEPTIIEIDSLEALARAAARVAQRGRVVLFTTRGLKWALTALNHIHFLRSYGFEGVLPVLAGREECERLVQQGAVKVSTCAWVRLRCYDPYGACEADEHNSIIWMEGTWAGNRMVWLEHLALMGYQVLMADSDICFVKDPFPALEATGMTIVTSGGLANFNLGALYANGRNAAGTQDLGMLTLANARYRQLMTDFVDFVEAWRQVHPEDGVKGESGGTVRQHNQPQFPALQALWDQDVVGDALHQWITSPRRQVYYRACINAHVKLGGEGAGLDGLCFSRCCDPEQVRVWNDTKVFHDVKRDDWLKFKELQRPRNIHVRPKFFIELSDNLGYRPQLRTPWMIALNCSAMQITGDRSMCSVYGLVHANTAPDEHWRWHPDTNFNSSDPNLRGTDRHMNFLRENCWFPPLTAVAKDWGVDSQL